MSGEIEAAGDLVTGAALARAVEPGAGEAGGTAASCLNCGARLAGTHCHVCGQKADVHRTLSAFWHDFTHSILHFEGKIWRTLPLLAFKPGELTRRYVQGERARFLSPLALFLFSVFLMFAVFSTVGLPVRVDPNLQDQRARAEGLQSLTKEMQVAKQRAAALEQERRHRVASGLPSAVTERHLAIVQNDITNLHTALSLARGLGTSAVIDDDIKINTGNRELDGRIRHAFENPQLLLYKMQSNGYKFSWALVLLSLPFVWLTFAWKRRFHAFDHLVFVTYSLCFVTLLLVSLSLFAAVGLSVLALPLVLIGIPLHLFAQSRGAYALTFRSGLWRTIYLLIAAALVLVLFALLLLAIGAT